MKKTISLLLVFLITCSILIAGSTAALSAAEHFVTEKTEDIQNLIDQAKEQAENEDYTNLDAPAPFKVLFLAYQSVKYNGVTYTMTTAQKNYLNLVARNFEASVEKFANNNVNIDITVFFVSGTTDISTKYNSDGSAGPFTITLGDAKAALSERNVLGTYDSVLCTSGFTGSSVLGMTYDAIHNGYGYSYINLGTVTSIPNLSRPTALGTQVAIHEWLHQLESFRVWLEIDYPDTHAYQGGDKYKDYENYTVDPEIEWASYYKDVLSAKVLYKGSKHIGMYPKMWRVTPRAMMAGTFCIKNAGSGQYLKLADDKNKLNQTAFIQESSIKWILYYRKNNSFTIINKEKYRFDVLNANNQNGTYINAGATSGVVKAQTWNIQTNDDGTYTIYTMLDGMRRCIQIGTESTARPVLYTPNGSDSQKWLFEQMDLVKEDTYYIKNAETGQYMDATGGNEVNVTDFASKISQQWKLVYKGDGYYTLTPMSNTSYYLDVLNAWNTENNYVNVGVASTAPRAQRYMLRQNEDGSFYIVPQLSTTRGVGLDESKGTRTVLKTLNGADTQKWVLERISKLYNGTYYIKNNSNSLYMEATGSNEVNVTSFAANSSHEWKFQYIGNDYYTITPMSNTSYYLDVLNAWNAENNYVNVGTKSTAPRAQSFRLSQNEDGTFYIIPKLSNTRGVAIGDSTGTRTVLKTLDGSASQKWVLENKNELLQGPYYIRNGANKLYMDATGGNAVNVTAFASKTSQKWKCTYLGDGYYTVTPMSNTSYYLDVVNAFDREDNYVNVGPKSTAPRAQSFRFIRVDDSTYQITPKMSTTRGIAIGDSTGTRTVLKTLNGTPLQEWSLTRA